MAEIGIGAVGLGLIVIAIGMSIWYATFLGNDQLADRFEKIEAPTNLVNFFVFVGDFTVAVVRASIDIMTFNAPDLPAQLQFTLRVVYGLFWGVGLLALIVSALPG